MSREPSTLEQLTKSPIVTPAAYRSRLGVRLTVDGLRRSEVILQTYLMEIDSGIGMLDAGIRQVLKTIAEIVMGLRAETVTHADVIAELKSRAQALVANRGVGKQMNPDAGFHVRT